MSDTSAYSKKKYKSTRFTEKQWDDAWSNHSFRIIKFWIFSLCLPEYVPWDGRYIKLDDCSVGVRVFMKGKPFFVRRVKFKLPAFLERFILKNNKGMV